MSKIDIKKDYKDGEVLHGSELNINNEVIELGVNDNYKLISELQNEKANTATMTRLLNNKVGITTFQEAITKINNDKVNKTDLATKANKTDLDVKADKADVVAQLATKADVTTVNDNLSTKANKLDTYTKSETYDLVYNNMTTKADKTYVDTQLGYKANSEDLNTKFDKTQAGDLSKLKTDSKDSLVDAINSINREATPIATLDTVGLVKPDGTTTTIDQDGTIHAVGGGGTGGTTDYLALANKPQINGVELSGNKSFDDLDIVSKTDLGAQLGTKADKTSIYTKKEVDDAIEAVNNSKVDKTYVDTKIDLKADKSTTYTKEEVNDLVETGSTTKADKIYVDTALEAKANKTDVYTTEAVDTKFTDAETAINERLSLKSDKEYTYTKTETDKAIEDYVAKSIGAPDEVFIGNAADAADSIKLVIDTSDNDPEDTLGTEVINNPTWEETAKAPSAKAISDTSSYSTDEIKTNATWIDGSPIYKKTIVWTVEEYINSLNKLTDKTIKHNISNFKQLIKYEMVSKESRPIPGFYSQNSTILDCSSSLDRIDNNNIYIRFINATLSKSITYYITLWYIK